MRLDHWVFAKIQAFRSDEEGASAIEYALIAAMVALGLVAFVGTGDSSITEKVKGIFQDIFDAM